MLDLAPSFHAVTYDDEWITPAADPYRGDLEVQVRLAPDDRTWHRKAIGGQYTACGRLGGYASRDESYEGQLCDDGCFSRFELGVQAPQPPDPPRTRSRRRSSPP